MPAAQGTAGASQAVVNDEVRFTPPLVDSADMPLLIATLGEGNSDADRAKAALALCQIEPGAAGLLPAFRTAMNFVDPASHWFTSLSLSQDSPPSGGGFPLNTSLSAGASAIVDLVRVRRRVARAVGKLGYSGYECVPTLVRWMGDKDAAVRTGSARSIGLIGSKSADASRRSRKRSATPMNP